VKQRLAATEVIRSLVDASQWGGDVLTAEKKYVISVEHDLAVLKTPAAEPEPEPDAEEVVVEKSEDDKISLKDMGVSFKRQHNAPRYRKFPGTIKFPGYWSARSTPHSATVASVCSS